MRRYFVCTSRTFHNLHAINGGLWDENLTNYKLQDPTIRIAGCGLVHIAKNWLWKFGVPFDKFFRVNWVVWCNIDGDATLHWYFVVEWCESDVDNRELGGFQAVTCVSINLFAASTATSFMFYFFVLNAEWWIFVWIVLTSRNPQIHNLRSAENLSFDISFSNLHLASRKCGLWESLYMC